MAKILYPPLEVIRAGLFDTASTPLTADTAVPPAPTFP